MTPHPARGGAWRRLVPPFLVLALAGTAALVAAGAGWAARPPLQHTFASPEAAAEAVLEAMHGGDLVRLRELAVSQEEFRAHVWPSLPASRRERNVPLEFAWSMLSQNSEGHLRQAVAALGGRPLMTPEAVQFLGEATRYGDVTVHRRATVAARTRAGDPARLQVFGSMIEQGGRWKVFSYVVDD